MNKNMAKTSPSAAGFFYRRIGGTLFKVRVYTGSGYADTLDEKISRLIRQDKLARLRKDYKFITNMKYLIDKSKLIL